jgi:hypothetical protein
MIHPLNPEDAPAAGNDETDPFAGSGDEASSEEYADNPGKQMAKHVISGDEEDGNSSEDESGGEMVVDGEDAAEPMAAASTIPVTIGFAEQFTKRTLRRFPSHR